MVLFGDCRRQEFGDTLWATQGALWALSPFLRGSVLCTVQEGPVPEDRSDRVNGQRQG